MQTNTSIVLVLLAIIGSLYFIVNQNTSINHQFINWKTKFEISFHSILQERYREFIFYQNLQIIQKHNADQAQTYKMGINQFTAFTQQEFVHLYLGTIYLQNNNQKLQVQNLYQKELKIQVDWVTKGAVTPVKNQGQCGSCWAFSCTGSLEGLYQITTGILKGFSEQQLMDCSGGYGNMGCNGGTMMNAFNYVRDHGICQQTNYPYKASKQQCINCTTVFYIGGYSSITGCTQLVNALSNRPISVVVDATNWSSYSNGVFNKCGANLNHGVLVVGISGGVWKVKNSWGNVWGEHGYIRLAPDDTCGICRSGAFPNPK